MLLPKRIKNSRKSKYINILEKIEVIDINTADTLISNILKGPNNEAVKVITSLDENNEAVHTMYIGDKSKVVSEAFYKTHLGLILSSDSFIINSIYLTRDKENNLLYKYQKQFKRNTIRRSRTQKTLSLTNKEL